MRSAVVVWASRWAYTWARQLLRRRRSTSYTAAPKPLLSDRLDHDGWAAMAWAAAGAGPVVMAARVSATAAEARRGVGARTAVEVARRVPRPGGDRPSGDAGLRR
jgi:hypothetical protein